MTLKRDEFFRAPEQIQEHLARQEGYLLEQRQDLQVALRVDESVAPAMFKPDPWRPGGYVANSLTLRAVRPDIFVAGDEIEALALELPCPNCNVKLDYQFWRLCPHCAHPLTSR